jgi:hypothetical protein
MAYVSCFTLIQYQQMPKFQELIRSKTHDGRTVLVFVLKGSVNQSTMHGMNITNEIT